MKIAIMQPYFFPYIGYFQLMNAVDEFIVYDNIEYSKGWINRNRILLNGKDIFITVPLKKDSDYKHVIDRSLAESWPTDRKQMLNKIKECYRVSPYFKDVFPIVGELLSTGESNLFQFLLHTLEGIKLYLGISTPLVSSSGVSIDHHLRSEEKVLAILTAKKADDYINPIGGLELYSKQRFMEKNLNLYFLKTNSIEYQQNVSSFVPHLSIIDVIMFNSRDRVREFLRQFTLL